jgi:Na+(H+)/acetate symporter ActP
MMKLMSMLSKKQPFLNLFRKKQNNKGVMWASLLSLAVSAVAYVLSRGQQQNTNNENKQRYKAPSLRNFVSSITPKGDIPIMNDAALTEFSEELISKAVQNK